MHAKIYIYVICIFLSHSSTSIELSTSLCPEGDVCDNFTSTDLYSQVEQTTIENENDTLDEYYDITDATSLPQPMHIVSNSQNLTKNRHSNVHKIKADFCLCDLTVMFCDINCCCDNDCNDFHMSVFSHCEEQEAKIYDSRYCYKQNFIVRNNTKLVHDKIADNLFCIAYDNLLPKFSSRENMVYDLKALKRDISDIENKREKWPWKTEKLKPTINVSNPYQSGDVIWKFYGKFLKPFELMQTGFTGHCTLKKPITYLEDWHQFCYQNDLTNQNKQLFTRYFSNFSILSSPLNSNDALNLIANQSCPKNICVIPTNYYCADSWNLCTTKESRRGICSNGSCENVVTNVKYLFRHNGTSGILKVSTFFKLRNVSSPFHQLIEVEFRWIDFDQDKYVTRSGNPGYVLGKPIVTGTSYTKTSQKSQIKFVSINQNNRLLTLAYSGKTKQCQDSLRYQVEFGQDAKSSCLVSLKTNNFDNESCIRLQNKTLAVLLKNLELNLTNTNPSRTFVSKSGAIFDDNLANWVQVFVEKVPKNSASARIIQDEIYCEGIVTSTKLHVLHSLVFKPENTNRHIILGVWLEFANETILSWPKCVGTGCYDLLNVNVENFVTFHDATKPSKYQFAIGPNIDIRLPYDFFYPFVSGFWVIRPHFALTGIILFTSYVI